VANKTQKYKLMISTKQQQIFDINLTSCNKTKMQAG